MGCVCVCASSGVLHEFGRESQLCSLPASSLLSKATRRCHGQQQDRPQQGGQGAQEHRQDSDSRKTQRRGHSGQAGAASPTDSQGGLLAYAQAYNIWEVQFTSADKCTPAAAELRTCPTCLLLTPPSMGVAKTTAKRGQQRRRRRRIHGAEAAAAARTAAA